MWQRFQFLHHITRSRRALHYYYIIFLCGLPSLIQLIYQAKLERLKLRLIVV